MRSAGTRAEATAGGRDAEESGGSGPAAGTTSAAPSGFDGEVAGFERFDLRCELEPGTDYGASVDWSWPDADVLYLHRRAG